MSEKADGDAGSASIPASFQESIDAMQALGHSPSIEEWLVFSCSEQWARRKAALRRVLHPGHDRRLTRSKRVQERVAAMLHEAKKEDTPLLPTLALVLKYMRVLGAGKDLVEALAWAPSSRNAKALVHFILSALGRQGGEEEKAALMGFLRQPGAHESHTAACIEALTHCPGHEVLTTISCFRNHPSPTVRMAVARGMARLGDPDGPAMMYACYLDPEWLAQTEKFMVMLTPEMQRSQRAYLARQRRKWRRAAALTALQAGEASHSESSGAVD